MEKGKLIVISGPSGVGKGTVIKAMMAQKERMCYSVSATTRNIRPSETDGVSYHFMSHEKFEQMIGNDEFLEHAVYSGEYYGTPAAPIYNWLDEGNDVIVEVEVQGAFQIKQRRPDAIMIFIAAPSFEELERRLVSRGDTPPEKIKVRLDTARFEYTQAVNYDYLVVNDDVARVTDEILTILAAEDCRPDRRLYVLKEAL